MKVLGFWGVSELWIHKPWEHNGGLAARLLGAAALSDGQRMDVSDLPSPFEREEIPLGGTRRPIRWELQVARRPTDVAPGGGYPQPGRL